MSEKCVKCGQPLPDNASFCPHCTAVQTEKQEIKAPKRWRKAAVSATAYQNNKHFLPAEHPVLLP